MFQTRMCTRACIWYTSISRRSSHFIRDIGFFRANPSLPLACALSFIIPLRRVLSSFAAVTPARDPLYQTKQSRTRSEDDSPYVRLLGDNLYTQSTYIITYSLDTSFSHARRRFSRFLYTSLRLVTARESHCCATFGNSTRVYSRILMALKTRVLSLLKTSLLHALKIEYNLLQANSIISFYY